MEIGNRPVGRDKVEAAILASLWRGGVKVGNVGEDDLPFCLAFGPLSSCR